MRFELGEVGLALSILTILVFASATLRRRLPFLRTLVIPNSKTGQRSLIPRSHRCTSLEAMRWMHVLARG